MQYNYIAYRNQIKNCNSKQIIVMANKKLKHQIKITVKEIDRITSNMLDISEMVGVYFGHAFRKCGKENCWCNKVVKGHPLIRITFNKNGKTISRAVPKNDELWIKQMTDKYRNFRQHFQKLRQFENKLNLLLDQFEEEVKRKSSRNKDYLKLL